MEKKKIGVTLDPALHNKVKSAAPLRGTNIEGAYDEALRKWLGEGDPSGIGTINQVSSAEGLWISRLLKVLRSRNNTAEKAVRGTIELAFLVPGVGDVGSNDPAPTDPPGTPPGLVQRAEDTHDATQQAIKRHKAARAGNPGSRKRA